MPQLVGMPCVVCNQRIVAARDAEFCSSCGNPVHQRCREAYRSPADSTRCRRCGGDAAEAPVAEVPTRFHPVPLLLALAALAAVAIIFFAWPSGGRSQAAREDNSVNAKEKSDAQTAQTRRPIVEIETTLGTIRAELFADKAPKTVQNFVDLVNKKFYDGIIFHRIIRDFMIQTGDPLGTGTGGRKEKGLPGKSLPDEFHRDLRHKGPGILSMANAGPNTGDTQFFITTVDTPHLDDKHSVFGKVIAGMDVVRKIERVETNAQDRPRQEVKMIHVRMVPPPQ